MIRLICAIGLLWTAVSPLDSFAQSSPSSTLVITAGKTAKVWDGWGTSLCWMGNAFGNRDDFADVLFTTKDVPFEGRTLPGLGLNIVRYNVGACSWNEVDGRKMAVSKIILPYRQMEGFWLDGKNPDPASASWSWSVDANQRAMLQKARDRGANWFELFSNSPMWWMCANDNPSGAAKGAHDNLRADQLHNFAVYMATVARHAKDHWGITFTTVEPFNEPVTDYWHADGKQEGCHFSVGMQAAILPLLRAELDKRELKDMKIAASDETYYDHALRTWQSFGATERALVDQVNVHGYQKEKGDRAKLAAEVLGKRLWNSEYGENDRSGLDMAMNINRDLRFLQPTAWCYWQPLDGGGWGLIDTDMRRKRFGVTNPKYHVLAQYTRHIRPGMRILDSSATEVVAALDGAAGKLVIVATNDTKEPFSRSIDLKAFAIPNGPTKSWTTEPHTAVRYVSREGPVVTDGRMEITLAPGAVQTIEISNAVLRDSK